MAHVNCPKCGKRLRIPDTDQVLSLQCPACKKTFQVHPATHSPKDLDYTEAGLGWFAKTAVAVMALAGTALLVFLVYKVASRDLREEKPTPRQLTQVVKKAEDASTPTTTITSQAQADISDQPEAKDDQHTQPAPQLPEVASKPAGMSPEELFAKTSPAVVRVVVRDKDFKAIGTGSGFFISEDGLLVTNYHVIEKAEFATVLLSSNATLFVDGVAATDAKADLALLKVNGQDLPHLTVATEQPPKVGAKVYAIGNPQGLTNTLSDGMVSGLRKGKEGLTLIQTTASISKGSSGGPLLTPDGIVIGVTSSYLAGGQNLNFAVPAGQVHRLTRKRGKLQTLASAGGKRLDKTATKELDKAWAAMRKKDWRTAAQILTRLRTTHKDNPFVWFALGYLHNQLKNHEIAIEHYKAAIVLKPDFVVAYYFMGYAYDALKRYPEAIAAYEKAIALKPDFAKAYASMGLAYDELKRFPEAIAAYKKAIALKPDFAEAYSLMGVAYDALKRFPEAIGAYKKAIALAPDFYEAYYNMGLVYGELNRPAEEIAAYKKAIVIKPDYAEAYLNMGIAYFALKRYPEAITAFKKAIAIKPDFAKAYASMGVAYESLKRFPEADAAYSKAIMLDPNGEIGRKARMYRASIRRTRRE